MRGTRSIGGVVGALLAITAGGIAVGSYSHPVGSESHPRIVVRQELGARAETGEYLVAEAYARRGRFRMSLGLFTMTRTGGRAEQRLSDQGTGGEQATYRDLRSVYAYASLCDEDGCKTRRSSRPSEVTVATSNDPISGTTIVTGKVRDLEFVAVLRRAEAPHPVGDSYEWWAVRPTTDAPAWLYAHRYLNLGARYEVVGFGVGRRNFDRPRYEYAARARFGHLDAWGS